jgi:hypothetical protein
MGGGAVDNVRDTPKIPRIHSQRPLRDGLERTLSYYKAHLSHYV